MKYSDDYAEALHSVIDTPAGKEFIWGILYRCGVGMHIPPNDSPETMEMLALRNFGLELLDSCKDADPYFYPNLFLQKAREEAAQKKPKKNEGNT